MTLVQENVVAPTPKIAAGDSGTSDSVTVSASALNQVTVVILNFNTLSLLQECLAQLEEVGVAPQNVIVVDNGSHDGSAEWLAIQVKDGLRTILLEQNAGFAAGNNKGIAAATTDYVLLLNTDAFPLAGSLDKLVATMRTDPTVGIVGGQLLYKNGKWQHCTGTVHSPRKAMLDAFGLPGLVRFFEALAWPITGQWWRTRQVGYVAGAAMLLRRSMLDRIGMLDEGFFFFVEDIEICERATRNGFKVLFVPSAQIIHLHGSSSKAKNPGSSARLQFASHKRFITMRYGEEGWKRYAAWKRRGYQWRLILARQLSRVFPGMKRKCETLSIHADLYTESSSQ